MWHFNCGVVSLIYHSCLDTVFFLFCLGIHKPVCAVSEAKFLTEAGWTDLRKPIDNDVPFRLFRDEGRTFLQVSTTKKKLIVC